MNGCNRKGAHPFLSFLSFLKIFACLQAGMHSCGQECIPDRNAFPQAGMRKFSPARKTTPGLAGGRRRRQGPALPQEAFDLHSGHDIHAKMVHSRGLGLLRLWLALCYFLLLQNTEHAGWKTK